MCIFLRYFYLRCTVRSRNPRFSNLLIVTYGVALVVSDPWRDVPASLVDKTPLLCSLITVTPDVTRALLEAGCSLVGARQWLTSDDDATAATVRQRYIDEGHDDVIEFIENTSTAPHRLSCLCRRALRAQLSQDEMAQLPLPTALMNYVTK